MIRLDGSWLGGRFTPREVIEVSTAVSGLFAISKEVIPEVLVKICDRLRSINWLADDL